MLSPGDVGTIDELGNLIARVGQATESDAAPGAKEADAMKRAAMSGAAQTTGAAYKSNAATKTNAATQTKAATKTTTAANSNAAENLMRSANAPTIKQQVIPAKVAWKAANSSSGM